MFDHSEHANRRCIPDDPEIMKKTPFSGALFVRVVLRAYPPTTINSQPAIQIRNRSLILSIVDVSQLFALSTAYRLRARS